MGNKISSKNSSRAFLQEPMNDCSDKIIDLEKPGRSNKNSCKCGRPTMI
jgi:hypothetical protein